MHRLVMFCCHLVCVKIFVFLLGGGGGGGSRGCWNWKEEKKSITKHCAVQYFCFCSIEVDVNKSLWIDIQAAPTFVTSDRRTR